MLNISGNTYKIDKKVLLSAAREAFLYLDEDFEVSFSFVSIKEIKRLNRVYRGKDVETDVLSFKLEDNLAGGEVVICYKKMGEDASEWVMSARDTAAFLLVHGILHLTGFDHTKETDRAKMEKAEENILKKIGVTINR